MSATFSQTLRSNFRTLFKINTEEVQIWGEMDRRDITISLYPSSDVRNVTVTVLNNTLRHLKQQENSKSIVYVGTPSRVNNLEEKVIKAIEKDKELNKEQEGAKTYVSTLYGDMGKRHKTVTIQDFCDSSSKYRVLLSTSAGDCGLNCSSCTLVVQDGFPKSIKDLVQKMGRSGRFRRQEPNNNPPECIIVPTLAGNQEDVYIKCLKGPLKNQEANIDCPNVKTNVGFAKEKYG